MSEVSYKEIIQGMTWSYSRIRSFRDCPYKFFMKYIAGAEEEDMFFSSYGKFIHSILEQFYKGELQREDLLDSFLLGFSENVLGNRPSASIIDSYIAKGVKYFSDFQPLDYKVVAVEHELNFTINGKQFVGYVDLIGKDSDGNLVIVDHKSRDLKPRSNRKKPTQNDLEIDDMLKQLYLYAEGVKQDFGKYPKYLCFNCFKSGTFIKEEFDIKKLKEAILWATKSIEEIEESSEFYPLIDFFKCANICGLEKQCVYRDWR